MYDLEFAAHLLLSHLEWKHTFHQAIPTRKKRREEKKRMLSGRSGFYLKVGKLYILKVNKLHPLSAYRQWNIPWAILILPPVSCSFRVNYCLSFLLSLKLENQVPWSHMRLWGCTEPFGRFWDWCRDMNLSPNSSYRSPPEIKSKEQIVDSWTSIYSGGKTGWKLELGLKIAWTILVSWQHSEASLLENAILKVLICML